MWTLRPPGHVCSLRLFLLWSLGWLSAFVSADRATLGNDPHNLGGPLKLSDQTEGAVYQLGTGTGDYNEHTSGEHGSNNGVVAGQVDAPTCACDTSCQEGCAHAIDACQALQDEAEAGQEDGDKLEGNIEKLEREKKERAEADAAEAAAGAKAGSLIDLVNQSYRYLGALQEKELAYQSYRYLVNQSYRHRGRSARERAPAAPSPAAAAPDGEDTKVDVADNSALLGKMEACKAAIEGLADGTIEELLKTSKDADRQYAKDLPEIAIIAKAMKTPLIMKQLRIDQQAAYTYVQEQINKFKEFLEKSKLPNYNELDQGKIDAIANSPFPNNEPDPDGSPSGNEPNPMAD